MKGRDRQTERHTKRETYKNKKKDTPKQRQIAIRITDTEVKMEKHTQPSALKKET